MRIRSNFLILRDFLSLELHSSGKRAETGKQAAAFVLVQKAILAAREAKTADLFAAGRAAKDDLLERMNVNPAVVGFVGKSSRRNSRHNLLYPLIGNDRLNPQFFPVMSGMPDMPIDFRMPYQVIMLDGFINGQAADPDRMERIVNIVKVARLDDRDDGLH